MTQSFTDSFTPAAGGQKIVWQQDDGVFGIALMQHPKRKHGSFSVQYGRQLDHDLTYAEACAKLGQAIMHAAACDDKLDNERD